MKKRVLCLTVYCFGVVTGIGSYCLRDFRALKNRILWQEPISGMGVVSDENTALKNVWISQGSKAFMGLQIDKVEGTITKAVFYDECNRPIAVLYMNNGKCNGVEVLTDESLPFFQVQYDHASQRWSHATYFKKTTEDTLISDCYQDINVDGQFDLINMFNRYGQFQGSAVYFNHTWNPAAHVGEDDLSAAMPDPETREKVHLVFDFREGWIPASMQSDFDSTGSEIQ